jgi:DNA-binding ferritin-like protein
LREPTRVGALHKLIVKKHGDEPSTQDFKKDGELRYGDNNQVRIIPHSPCDSDRSEDRRGFRDRGIGESPDCGHLCSARQDEELPLARERSHFRDYHLLFDEQADSLLGSIDTLAERMRRIGATTIRSIQHIAGMQTIHDDNSEFVSPERMIQTLIEDNRHMAERQRGAIEVCEKHRDTPTANLLQDILNETEKRIWFLYEVSQGGRNIE